MAYPDDPEVASSFLFKSMETVKFFISRNLFRQDVTEERNLAPDRILDRFFAPANNYVRRDAQSAKLTDACLWDIHKMSQKLLLSSYRASY